MAPRKLEQPQEDDAHLLLMQVRAGNREAARVLYQLYLKNFYGNAIRRLRSSADAWDAVQNTFLKVLRSIETYNPDDYGGRGEPWLWTILDNEVLERLRKRATEQSREAPDFIDIEVDIPAPDEDILEIIEQEERWRAEEAAWNSLSEEDLAVLKQGRGRGRGRTQWHEVIKKLEAAYHTYYPQNNKEDVS